MKRHADEHRRDVEFNEGEWVYLKLRPYRQQSVARRRNEKLAPKYYGPFRIIARIGKVAYKLQLPETASIHPVFHVSLLKKAMGMNDASSKLPVTLTEDMEIILEPEQVEGIRGGACEAEMEVLIKWKDLPGFESTWEPFVTIKKQFPEFHLEDKVAVWEGSIDKTRFKEVYQRRRRNNYKGGTAS